MARKRITSPQQIKNLDDANAALAEIGSLELRLEKIDGEASQRIGKIKEAAASAGEESRDRIKELESALALFAEYNKAELFREKKTIELSYGEIGFRKSTKVSVKKSTIELLKKLFPGKGIRVKEEIDKEALAEFEDGELAQVDAAKVENDVFGYKVNRDEINKRLLQAG
jgi:phage host-nuclease inhibitor protein Gam